MEAQRVEHIQVNGRYKVVIERIGSAKGTVGIKVEANGDDIGGTLTSALSLFKDAKNSVTDEVH